MSEVRKVTPRLPVPPVMLEATVGASPSSSRGSLALIVHQTVQLSDGVEEPARSAAELLQAQSPVMIQVPRPEDAAGKQTSSRKPLFMRDRRAQRGEDTEGHQHRSRRRRSLNLAPESGTTAKVEDLCGLQTDLEWAD